MAEESSKPDISRFKTVLGNNEYIMVAGRILLAHHDNDELRIETEMLAYDLTTTPKTFIYKATVTTRKGVFTGHAMSDENLKGLARNAPLEVAETSAVGRALAAAGYALESGIASADEMEKAGYTSGGDIRVTVPAPSQANRLDVGEREGRIAQKVQQAQAAANGKGRVVQRASDLPGNDKATPWERFSGTVSGRIASPPLNCAQPLVDKLMNGLHAEAEIMRVFDMSEADQLKYFRDVYDTIQGWTATAHVSQYAEHLEQRVKALRAKQPAEVS